MTVYFDKQRKKWRYTFVRRGQRYSRYCVHPVTGELAANKSQAVKIERLVIAKIEENARTRQSETEPIAPGVVAHGSEFTLAECLAESIADAKEKYSEWKIKISHTRDLTGYFGKDRPLRTISAADINKYRDDSKSKIIQCHTGGPRPTVGEAPPTRPHKKGKRRSHATINKHLKTLRKAWRQAYDKHIEEMPDFPMVPRFQLLQEMEELPNPIRDEDIEKILRVAAPHVSATLVLAAHTGLRLNEALDLPWKEVDLRGRKIMLSAKRTKSKRGRVIPLNDVATKLLTILRDQCPNPDDPEMHVILYWPTGGEPRPVKSIKTGWKSALERAGLANKYRFHDSRGSFCTALAEKGVGVLSIMQITGHRDLRTTQRYVNVADPVQIEAVARLATRQGTQGFEKTVKVPVRRSLAKRSSYRGVYAKRGKSVYEARITIVKNGKKHPMYLGTYRTPEEAAKAFDNVARTIPGRQLNFPNPSNRKARSSQLRKAKSSS